MKLKLKQKIAIGYYKTTLRSLAFISKRKAAEKTFELFCTPFSGKPKRVKPVIFKHAEKVEVEVNKQISRGWKWNPTHSINKTVLITHGFDSCSYKFEKYIQPLLHEGFTVLAFDAIGHGISDGKTVNAVLYKQCIEKIDEKFGSLYAIIGHSLGGLAAGLATEKLSHIKKLVLVAPATETTRAIDNFFRFVQLGNQIKNELIQLIEEYGNASINYFSVNRIANSINQQILWLHDEDDWVCPASDIDKSLLNKPNIKFIFTKGLGHNKIYKVDSTIKSINQFLID